MGKWEDYKKADLDALMIKKGFEPSDKVIFADDVEIIYEGVTLTKDEIKNIVEEDNVDQYIFNILNEYDNIITISDAKKKISDNMNVAEYLDKYKVKDVIPLDVDIVTDEDEIVKGSTFITKIVIPYILIKGETDINDIISRFSTQYDNKLSNNNFVSLLKS